MACPAAKAVLVGIRVGNLGNPAEPHQEPTHLHKVV